MNAVETAIWDFCRAFSYGLEAIGLGGLLMLAGAGLWRFYNKLIEED